MNFEKTGLPFIDHGANEAVRKDKERRVGTLVDIGLLVAFGKGERRTAVRLSHEGDLIARALCGLPGLEPALLTLGEVQRLEDTDPEGWVDEGLLAGWTPPDEENENDSLLTSAEVHMLETVEMMALPALVRGWLEANSTTSGWGAYWLADRGREILKNPPDPPARLPKEQRGLARRWTSGVIRERSKIRARGIQLRDREIGMPLMG